MNSSSLDWSIESTLSSLFPPFEATAPTVLSQLFRTIDERYNGDTLQCLLDYLIPAKHILESVQQAACAEYCDVLFRCEGWPLCLRDRVVIQLAPINPLLLRPGDFYLQVEPFGEQSARIVLKSLLVQEALLAQEDPVLQAGFRVQEGLAVEETPIPETCYPYIFSEVWLKEINEERHSNQLYQCVLSSDQGIVKVPWTEVINPEFLDKPKVKSETTTACSTSVVNNQDNQPPEQEPDSQFAVSLSSLEAETMILPAKSDISVQMVESGCKCVKVDQGKPLSNNVGKPIGWVSPNTWDSRHNCELEGEYVDLLDLAKEKEGCNKAIVPSFPVSFRPTPHLQKRDSNCCLHPSSMLDEHCVPRSKSKQLPEDLEKDSDSKGRYRQSYIAALRNPLCFEKTSVMAPLNETWPGLGETETIYEAHAVGLETDNLSSSPRQCSTQAGVQSTMKSSEDSISQDQNLNKADIISTHLYQNMELPNSHICQSQDLLTEQLPKDLCKTMQGCKSDPVNRQHCLTDATRKDPYHMPTNVQKHAKSQHVPKMGIRALPDRNRQELNHYTCQGKGVQQINQLRYEQMSPYEYSQQIIGQRTHFYQPQNNQEILQNQVSQTDPKPFCDNKQYGASYVRRLKVLSKNRPKAHSAPSVSDVARACLQQNRPTCRSRSDVCPEIITMLPEVHVQQNTKNTASGLVSPKLDKRKEVKTAKVGAVKPSAFPNGEVIQSMTKFQLQNISPEHGPFTHLSQDPTTKIILQLGIICLPGSRDRAGRAVIEVHGFDKGWASPLLTSQELSKLVLYLHSIPRREVRELGLTVVIDSRKGPLPAEFYNGLVMVQEEAPHAVHGILMLVEKDQFARLDKQQELQVDIVTSMKALHRSVDGQQLTSKLGGTFPYNHTDWLQFYQKLSLFELDLQGAALLLQRAIKRLDSNKNTATAKDVKYCIQEQKSLMKEVLEDTQMITLQRAGGAILARMRKEEFRFVQSEDYSDTMDTMMLLYNRVEEGVHNLVMRSNQSLQHLEHVLLLRETEEQLNTIREWCEEKVIRWHNDTTAETSEGLKKRQTELNSVLTQAKDKKEKAMSLIKDIERRIQGTHYPENNMFHINVTRFKTNMAAFLLQVEQNKSDLKTLILLHLFCEQALDLARECSHYLEHMEMGCYAMEANFNNLKSFQERFKAFTPEHFAMKNSKTMTEKHTQVKHVWSEAWSVCQKVKQRLEDKLLVYVTNQTTQRFLQKADEMLRNVETSSEDMFPGIAKSSYSQWVGEHSLANQGSPARCEMGSLVKLHDKSEDTQVKETQCFPQIIPSVITQKTPSDQLKKNTHLLLDQSKKDNESSIQNVKLTGYSREHHSEVDLRNVDLTDWNRALGRSHSEGSCIKFFCSSSGCHQASVHQKHHTGKPNVLPYDQKHLEHQQASISSDICNMSLEWNQMAIRDQPAVYLDDQESQLSRQESFCSSISSTSQVWIKEGEINNSDENIPESHSSRPRTSVTLQDTTVCSSGQLESSGNVLKLQHIIEELLQTEREYVRALSYVMEHYFPELERPDVPQDLRGQHGSIFGNLEKLKEFHQHHFLKELELCLRDPFRVGHCFLRHKESFGLYALYSKNKPRSDHLIINHGKEFFKHKQQQLGDRMDLSSYLLKPVQRISKYSLLLQDMLQECELTSHKGHEHAEIQSALEVIQFQLRHGNNLLAMDDIQECDVNLKEQGHLIHQDEFLVYFRKKKCYRHIFLFQELILFSKTKRTEFGNDTYIYKQSFKTSDIGMTHTCGDSGLCFEIWFRRQKSHDTYTIQARTHEIKEAWTKDLERILWEQAIHNREIRMQERVFMGIGNKPFMDIKPSEAAICDRAINCIPTGRDCKTTAFSGRSNTQGAQRPHSIGAASNISSCSHSSSSSSSGWGSTSPAGYQNGHRGDTSATDLGRVCTALAEYDLDHKNTRQNMDCSESSGECGFSRSSCSRRSLTGGGLEEHSSNMAVTCMRKPCSNKIEMNHQEHTGKPIQSRETLNQITCETPSNIQENNRVTKSTEV